MSTEITSAVMTMPGSSRRNDLRCAGLRVRTDGAAVLLPRLGLIGAAAAYGAATTITSFATYVTCRSHFPLKFEGRTAVALVRALLLLGAVMIAGTLRSFDWDRLLVAAAAIAVWLAWTLTDEGAREVLTKVRRRRAAQ